MSFFRQGQKRQVRQVCYVLLVWVCQISTLFCLFLIAVQTVTTPFTGFCAERWGTFPFYKTNRDTAAVLKKRKGGKEKPTNHETLFCAQPANSFLCHKSHVKVMQPQIVWPLSCGFQQAACWSLCHWSAIGLHQVILPYLLQYSVQHQHLEGSDIFSACWVILVFP